MVCCRIGSCEQTVYTHLIAKAQFMEETDKDRVSDVLEEIGKMLALKDENPFKIRAYEDAARTISSLTEDLGALVEEERLSDLEGIGEGLSEKISELVRTGRMTYYEDLREEIPEGLLTIMDIEGLGPKKAKALWDELHITTLDELAEAVENEEVRELDGFGAKTEENIEKGIRNLRKYRARHRVHEAHRAAEPFLAEIQNHDHVNRARLAGSLRRHCETIGDVDILASVDEGDRKDVVETFTELDRVEDVLGSGETKSSVRTRDGIQVDLRLVNDDQFPFALHYFTGSKEHNVTMRSIAQSRSLKLNEYGLFHEENGEERIDCENEEEVFEELGMSYIPPELREDMGEVEQAQDGSLPELVEEEDVRGVFHVHTTWSDGKEGLEEMVLEAKDLGYEYIGISDHSESAQYAGGLTAEEVEEQWEEIEQVREKVSGIRIFRGIESDIRTDGSLDYSDELLSGFDFVVSSIHQNFGLSEEDQTERIITALQNEHTTFLGHPTGRLLLSREEYDLDMNRVIEAAAETDTIIEINANPERLDMDWRFGPLARELEVRTAINPDAHSFVGLRNVRWGVGIARKAWFRPEDVVNTRSADEVEEMLSG